jgi:hypothetical protein
MSGSTLRTAVADTASSRFSVAILLFLEAFLGAGGLGSAIESNQLQTATVEKQRSALANKLTCIGRQARLSLAVRLSPGPRDIIGVDMI